MPATPTEPRLALALTAVLLGLPACASNHDPTTAAPTPARAPEPVTMDMRAQEQAAPAPPASPVQELEASLAAYEAQLASNEARLRAMGVRIAAVEPDEEPPADDRFAPPPPGRSGLGYKGDADKRAEKAEGKAKSTRARPADEPAMKRSPTSRPASASPPSPPSPQSAAGPAKSADGETAVEQRGGCTDLCELASATCDLEARICDLASRHLDEPRYAQVCQRAQNDCRAASDACNACSP